MGVDLLSDDRPITLDDVAHLSLFEGKYRPIIREFNKRRSEEALRMMDQAYDAMLDDGLETPEEKNKRYKLSFDAFRAIHKLDKEKGEVEQTGPFAVSVNFVPVRKQHDQREKKKEETDELR